MRVIEKGYAYKQRCNKCNALILIEYNDIETVTYTEYDGFKEQYEGFYCPICHNFNVLDKTNKINYSKEDNDAINLSFQKTLRKGNKL